MSAWTNTELALRSRVLYITTYETDQAGWRRLILMTLSEVKKTLASLAGPSSIVVPDIRLLGVEVLFEARWVDSFIAEPEVLLRVADLAVGC